MIKIKIGIIYGYKKTDINKIVYIGQTVQLKIRHKKHFDYDPYDINCREYNYPLSKSIRKYGKECFELIILEDNIKEEDLDNRERYYIKLFNTYFNGYNQNKGGKEFGKSFSIYQDEIINDIIEMLKLDKSFLEISNKTGVSLPHISNINTGYRCKKENIDYPIKTIHTGGKLSDEEVEEIVKLLLNTKLTQKTIANIYNVKQSIISKINFGLRKNIPNYTLYNFPLRQGKNYEKQ